MTENQEEKKETVAVAETKKETVARSYRLTEEVIEKIAALGDMMHISQNEVFETLIGAYELQQDINLVPDAANDLKNFASHLQSIQDSYHNLVNINQQTEERMRQEFQLRLENNEQQINELRETKKKQKDKIETLKKEAEEKDALILSNANAISAAEQQIEEKDKIIEDKQIIINNLTERLPEQAEIDAKIESLEEEINNLRISLTASESAKAEALSRIEKAEANLAINKNEIETLKKDHKKELETVAKQSAADLKAAIAEAKETEREKAREREDKLQEKIEEYRAKIDGLKDEISNLKDNIKNGETKNA